MGELLKNTWGNGNEKNYQNFKSNLQNTKYILSFVLKMKKGKSYIILNIVNSLINSVFPIILTIFPGLIINELIGEKNINTLILYVSLLVCLPLLRQIYQFISNRIIYRYSLDISTELDQYFYIYNVNMDYENIENPNIQILKGRTQKTLEDSLNVVNQLSTLLLAIFSLIGISVIVSSLNVFIIFIKKRSNIKKHGLSQKLSKYDREQGAYVYMLEDFSYAKETRLFESSQFLANTYANSKKESNVVEVSFRSEQNKPPIFN